MSMKRDSNIELLRVIAAFSIVICHSMGALVNIFGYPLIFQTAIVSFFWALARVSVNIFVMITAWYLCDKAFKFNRIVKTWLGTAFYTIPIAFIYLLLGQGGLRYIFASLTPVLSAPLGFISLYIPLLLISPFLNLVLEKYDEKKLKGSLLIFSLLFIVAPSVFPMFRVFHYHETLWYCLLYLIIGYLKKHPISFLEKKRFCCIGFIIFYAFIVFWYLFYPKFAVGRVGEILNYAGFARNTYFFNLDSIPCFLTALFLFFLFKNITIKTSGRIIYFFSNSTFDVYILLSVLAPSGIYAWIDISQAGKFVDNHIGWAYFVTVLAFLVAVFIGHVRSFVVKRISKKLSWMDELA
jgi:Uncharacterized protein conserved in bacteria